jgi:hypothetical protein
LFDWVGSLWLSLFFPSSFILCLVVDPSPLVLPLCIFSSNFVLLSFWYNEKYTVGASPTVSWSKKKSWAYASPYQDLREDGAYHQPSVLTNHVVHSFESSSLSSS